MTAVEISDWDDLDDVRLDVTDSYILVNNLTTSTTGYASVASSTANSGAGWSPITSFSGTLDGDDYEIQDVYISNNSTTYMGLFGTLSSNATIKNVKLYDIDYNEGNSRMGGLVGLINAVSGITIDNCHVTGTMTLASSFNGGRCGGLIAWCAPDDSSGYSKILDCTVDVDILHGATSSVNNSSSLNVGGFIGIVNATRTTKLLIDNCHVVGYPEILMLGFDIGGFIGYCKGCVYNCSSNAYVHIRTSSSTLMSGIAGGFIGEMGIDAEIYNCFSTGLLKHNPITDNTGSLYGFGGFTGDIDGFSEVHDCYSTTNLEFGSYSGTVGVIGGFVGHCLGSVFNSYSAFTFTGTTNTESGFCDDFDDSYSGVITNCFWNTTTSGITTTRGAATGKTTTEMKDIDTFTDTSTTGLTSSWSLVEDTSYSTETGTASSSSSTTLVDSSKSWTTNEFAGLYVHITDGTGVGQLREISSNTSTTLTVASSWLVNPSTDSDYEITAPWFIDDDNDYPRLWFEYEEPVSDTDKMFLVMM